MIPVVELLRVSTEAQAAEDRAGLAAQHTTNVRTCAVHGLEIVAAVEIVESGAEVARSPEMARVMEYVTSRRARGVVLAEYSRLFRPDRWSDMIVLQTLSDHDARIYLPSGPIDLQSELGFVQATINNLLAAMERRRIRERMDRGKEEHRRRGEHVAGGIGLPFGTAYTREGGWQWTEDAAVVRELFRRFLAGERNYDELGRLLGMPRTNTKFLLQNPIYSGWRIYDKRCDLTPAGKYPGGARRVVPRRPEEVIRVRLPLEPLVSEADFALVQEIIAEKSARNVRRVSDAEFLYRGFLQCACGSPLYSKYTTRKDLPPQRWYYCRSRHPGRRAEGEPCPTGYMVREKVERLLDEAITERLTDPDVLVAALGAYVDAHAVSRPASDVDAASLAERRASLERKRERIMEAYYDGISSKADRDRRLAQVAEEVAATERMLGMVEPDPDALTEHLVGALVDSFAGWTHLDRPDRRRILEAIAPVFFVEKYRVTGVRFPLSTLTSGSHSGNSPRTADPVTTLSTPFRRQNGLYIPLCA